MCFTFFPRLDATLTGGTGVGSFSTTRFLRFSEADAFFEPLSADADIDASCWFQDEFEPPPGPAFVVPGPTASGRKSLNSARRSGASLNKPWTWAYTCDWVPVSVCVRKQRKYKYILKVFLLLLVSLKDVQKLSVCVGVVCIPRFDLVQVMYGMVKFSWRLNFDGILVIEIT